jgi:RNA polymerase sigma-70 factor (ECF subfamily)
LRISAFGVIAIWNHLNRLLRPRPAHLLLPVAKRSTPMQTRPSDDATAGEGQTDDRSHYAHGRARGITLADAYREHAPGIYRYLCAKTGDPSVAEDLTQEVFAQAASLSEPLTSPGLLYLIARRRFIDRVRENHRRGTYVSMDSDLAGEIQCRVCYPGFAREIREAVLSLSPCQRRVFVMRLLEGRSFADIASELCVSEPACRKRFDRARELVRARLACDGFPAASDL